MKTIIGLTLVSILIFGIAQAQTTEETTQEQIATEVGNKICPVSGEKIKEEEKFQVEHEGKIYNLCCKMCVKDFKKDPEKYIKKIEEQLQAESTEEARVEETKEENMPMPESGGHHGHEGHQH